MYKIKVAAVVGAFAAIVLGVKIYHFTNDLVLSIATSLFSISIIQ